MKLQNLNNQLSSFKSFIHINHINLKIILPTVIRNPKFLFINVHILFSAHLLLSKSTLPLFRRCSLPLARSSAFSVLFASALLLLHFGFSASALLPLPFDKTEFT